MIFAMSGFEVQQWRSSRKSQDSWAQPPSPSPHCSTLAPPSWARPCLELTVAFVGSAQTKKIRSKSRVSPDQPARGWSEPALPPWQCLLTVLGPPLPAVRSKHPP